MRKTSLKKKEKFFDHSYLQSVKIPTFSAYIATYIVGDKKYLVFVQSSDHGQFLVHSLLDTQTLLQKKLIIKKRT